MAQLSVVEIVQNAGFSPDDFLYVDGDLPFSIVYINVANGELSRGLTGYFDLFIPTRPVKLVETTGGMRRKNFVYKKGMIGFNEPEANWSVEWLGVLEGVTIIFDPKTIAKVSDAIYGERFETLKWRTALSDNVPTIAYLGLDIASQVGTGFPVHRDILTRQVETLIAMLLRRYSRTSERDTSKVGIMSPQVLRAIQFIDSKLKDHLTSDIISEACYTSTSQLNRLFRAEVGRSLWGYVLDKRLDSARSELQAGAAAVETVAKIYRFKSRTTFSKQFKARFGCAPSHFNRS